METVDRMTPAEHRVKAEEALNAMRIYPPGSDAYHGLVMSAIAHVLVAVAVYLEPPPDPGIPGLPAGWKLDVRQSGIGDHSWGYALSPPDGERVVSRYDWKSSETALAAAVRAARAAVERELHDELDGYNLLLHTWWRLG